MPTSDAKPLRLWPGVVIVVLQLAFFYIPGYINPASMAWFYSMMGATFIGGLLIIVWWLFFSRASWPERLGILGLMIVLQTAAVFLAHDSTKFSVVMPGVVLLCAAFVASLFFARRAVTVAAIVVASLGWVLLKSSGVTGAMESDYSLRWSSTAEERFVASDAARVPTAPAPSPAPVLEEGEVPQFETAAWPGFRGAGRDSVLAGVTIDPDWSSNPPQELWRRPVGPGWSSFALVGHRLCTQEQRDEDEVVVCYDAATGEPIWLHSDRARFWEALAGAGPRATPTYHEGHLYTLGATGILNCLDAQTGARKWMRNIATDTGAEIPDWGFSSSPLIVDDLVVVHAAGAPDGKEIAAYDLATGEPRWNASAVGASYSSPHLTTIDGVRQIIQITGEGIYSVTADTGAPLWSHVWSMGPNGSRVIQPAFPEPGAILIGTSFGLGTRLIKVWEYGGVWNVNEGWTTRGLKPYYNDLVLHRGHAFGFDGNIMSAISLETGERAWKGGRYGNGQVLLLPDQDLMLVLSEKGQLALVKASADGFEEVAKVDAIKGKTWNHPVLVDGVLYVRNGEEAAAFRLAGGPSARRGTVPFLALDRSGSPSL